MPKRKKPKKIDPATEKLLKRVGYYRAIEKYGKPKPNFYNEIPDLTVNSKYELSNRFDKAGPKVDPLAHKWKKDCEEPPHVMEERSRLSCAPLYNKGAYQLITPGTDPTTIGRK